MGLLETLEKDIQEIKVMLETALKSTGNENDDLSKYPTALTVEHISEILGIGRVQAYELVKTQDFPKKLIGKRIIIYKQAFINWLSATERR